MTTMKRGNSSVAVLLAALATLPLVVGLSGCAQSPTGPEAASPPFGTWRLVSLQQSPAPPVSVSEPDRFTAEFRSDGRLGVRADCNSCGGNYTAQGEQLEVGLMACTLAFCSSAPLDTQYVGLLQQATSWREDGGVLELRSKAGVLRFRR